MDTEDIVWIVVGALVLLALLAALLWALRRRKQQTEQRKVAHAESLRQEAAERSEQVRRTDLEAREAQLEAERKRLEAERAEQRATESQQYALQEQAEHEDVLRRADATDPRVDTRSEDYRDGGDTRRP